MSKMNVPAAILVLSSVAATASAGLSVFHRGLAVTQKCLDDTKSMYSKNSDLEEAYDMLKAEVNRGASCFDGEGFCNINYESLDSSSAFKDACDAAGGQTIMLNATTDCPNTNIMFLYMNVMDCVSKSCTATGVEGRADDSFERASMRMQSLVDDTCDHGTADFVTNYVPSDKDDEWKGLATAGFVLGLLAFLFAVGYIGYFHYDQKQKLKKAERRKKFSGAATAFGDDSGEETP